MAVFNDAWTGPLTEAALRAQFTLWRERFPGTSVLALLPEAEKAGIALLQDISRECALPLSGAVFPAIVAGDDFSTSGCVLLAMPSGTRVTMFGTVASGNTDDAMGLDQAIDGILRLSRDLADRDLFLIFDALVPNIGSICQSLREVLANEMGFAGVNAGSETFQSMPCLFSQSAVVRDGVLAIWLPRPLKVVLKHGYPVSKAICRATSATDNRIVELDGKPAFLRYQEAIREEFGIELTQENFYNYAVHYPFGLVTALDVLVRIPVAFLEDHSLVCVGEIPPHSILKLLGAPRELPLESIREIAADLARLGSAQTGKPLLTFYCAGRRMHFLDRAGAEVKLLRQESGASALLGALSLGEIEGAAGSRSERFHNAAIVCIG